MNQGSDLLKVQIFLTFCSLALSSKFCKALIAASNPKAHLSVKNNEMKAAALKGEDLCRQGVYLGTSVYIHTLMLETEAGYFLKKLIKKTLA